MGQSVFDEVMARAMEVPAARRGPLFRRGDRVRLSALARDTHLFPRHPHRRATVLHDLGHRGAVLVQVRWDGVKTRSSVHPDFLELVTAGD